MSFFFGHLVGTLTSKYRTLKTQYKLYEDDKYMHKNHKNYTPPNHLKNNPFYWADLIKTSITQSAKNFYINLKNRPKALGYNPIDKNNIPTIKEATHKLSSYTKQASLALLENVNKLIINVTFGYLDFKKIYYNSIQPFYTNYSLPMIKHINYRNLIILYRNMGNNLANLNQKTMTYLSKYRDPKAYEEFKNYYDNYVNKMDRDGRNGKYSTYFRKFVPGSFWNLKMMTGSKLNKVNKYVKAPYYKQKFYNYEIIVKKWWSNREQIRKYFSYSYYKENVNKKTLVTYYEQVRYEGARGFFKGGIKRRFRKIGLYIGGFFVTYYTLKYFIYKLFNRKQDKNLQEALSAVKELKSQNEELMKFNREIMDRLVDNRKNN